MPRSRQNKTPSLGISLLALGGGIAAIWAVRRFRRRSKAVRAAVTIMLPVSEVREAWLRWKAVADQALGGFASARFVAAPGSRGTEVHLQAAPGVHRRNRDGLFAQVRELGPQERANDLLRGFKQILETGELATTEGQPAARRKNKREPGETLLRWAGVMQSLTAPSITDAGVAP